MIRDFNRDQSRDLPTRGASQIRHLRIWHCRFKSLKGLASYTNLETLVVATYPDPSLAPLAGLAGLRYLRLLHLPKVEDLAPLAEVSGLRTLRLETLPSWDSSGKATTVKSLAPIASLPSLKHLELFGIRPGSQSLADLESSTSLETVRVSKFPRAEVKRFMELTGLSDDFAPRPDVPDWS